MKLPFWIKTLSCALLTTGALVTVQQVGRAAAVFECLVPVTGPYVGVPTTAARLNDNTYKAVIRWTSYAFSGSGYTPMQRCQEVTARFNKLRSRLGGLEIITTGYLNGLPVIYSPVNGRERANVDNLLFTLKRGENATAKVQQLFDLREGASSSPLFESSSDGNSITVNFDKFLENAPVDNGFSANSSAPVSPVAPSGQPSTGGSSW